MRAWKRAVISFVLWCGWINLLTAAWGTFEIAMYGEIQQRSVDTIIAVAFATVLWYVSRGWWEVEDDD